MPMTKIANKAKKTKNANKAKNTKNANKAKIMNVRLKLAELQKSRKRRLLPIDESSEMVEQQHRTEVYCVINRNMSSRIFQLELEKKN
uniref:Uncharacterized protein n=1 Tax=Meloidogyne hapla TaxID=6305 RepID=A0A1I8BRQ6_MELHA